MALLSPLIPFLGQTALIQRQSVSKDASGGSTETWTTLATTKVIPCDLPQAKINQSLGRNDALVNAEVSLFENYNLKTGDRIVIGTKIYDVVGSRDGYSDPTDTNAIQVDCFRRKV